MKEVKVKREAKFGQDKIYFRYSLWIDGRYTPIFELSKYFPSLTSVEITDIIKKEVNKFKIEKACLGSVFFDVRETTKKDKREIRQKHKKIMKFFKSLLNTLITEEEKKNLTEWVWSEKEFIL